MVEQTGTPVKLSEEDIGRIAAEVARRPVKITGDVAAKLQQAIDILTGAGLCAIVFAFDGAQDIRFSSRFTNNPGESHFEIAGREALAIARKLRDARLDQQLKIQPGS